MNRKDQVVKKSIKPNNFLPLTIDTYLDHHKDREINWLDLPDHVLGFVTNKFINIIDFIRFGVVCRSWRSIYIQNMHRHFPHTNHQLPLLMLPPTEHDQHHTSACQTRNVYSLSEKKILPNFQLRVPLSKFCRGSSHGWLITLDENLTDVHLLNPFLLVDNEIQLPPLTSLPHEEGDIYNECFLPKVVLSANPASNPNYAAMAIYGQFNTLAFLKSGDKTWKSLDNKHMVMEDVIYFKDHFYSVSYVGSVFSCDVNHPHPKIEIVAPCPSNHKGKNYLVDFFGDLLQIRRVMMDPSEDYTARFEVFKLDLCTRKWSQLESLGDQALFVGDNYSVSLSSSDFPVCIYFTDDNIEQFCAEEEFGGNDIGVFDLKDKTIEPHYPTKSKFMLPAPIWIEPTLQPCHN
ncbi:hypothetical protein AQUCO_00100023v1 [Aquilegia coerulea]|uniref:KIB1-4 beta-propeller domain-containing protein n=1 Tax=Aquilegia coerulea TaxID=218851 RepID=A0A2G5F8D5_AQUCA|nr:hypothetical protein AQUCO_00100023v1 [Aquilegia coerulea]